MHLCIVTDEISQDLAHALDVCEDEGVSTVELRAVDGANIVSHDDDSLEKIKAMIDGWSFRVRGISISPSPPLGRSSGGSSSVPSK